MKQPKKTSTVEARELIEQGYESVKPFFKSSFSMNGGSCVEVGVWKKGAASVNNGACVEVAGLEQEAGSMLIGVRDTKQHGKGPMLTYTPAEWEAFIAGVKANEFDLQ
jgi:hypothetical protein